MIVSFKEKTDYVTLDCKNSHNIFFIHFAVWYRNFPVGHNMLEETVKRLCKGAGNECQFTNHNLRATTATRLGTAERHCQKSWTFRVRDKLSAASLFQNGGQKQSH